MARVALRAGRARRSARAVVWLAKARRARSDAPYLQLPKEIVEVRR
jgi:hypothetical protein